MALVFSRILLIALFFTIGCSAPKLNDSRVEGQQAIAPEKDAHATDFDVEEVMAVQREFASKLTGHSETEYGISLGPRFTPEDRELARQYLVAQLEAIGLESFRHTYREDGANIYTVLEATRQSDEYIIVGAHFDSDRVSPGASDNVSGCALLFAVAKLMSQVENRSINFIFIFFDEEESGLIGSTAFARKMVGDELSIASVHTIDQIGWDADGDRAVELETPYDGAAAIYEQAAIAAGLDITIHTTRVTSTDHHSFRQLGMTAVGVTEEYVNGDTSPHYHQATDQYETINFEYLASSTRLVYEVMKILGAGRTPGR